MNYYPGEGLGVGTAVLGGFVGQIYTTVATAGDLCKIYGLLKDIQGEPVGAASTTLDITNGVTSLTPAWNGVQVTATITTADAISGAVITTERVSVSTNESGYFEVYTLQGLAVVLSCPVFGKTLSVDTTGHASIDISTLF
jgi:hypothetical protein